MSYPSAPHLRLPFQVANGAARVVEQDSMDDVLQCVSVLMSTVQGERIELPDYGIDEPTFTAFPAVETYRGDVQRWEPRATVGLDPLWKAPLDLTISTQVALLRPNANA